MRRSVVSVIVLLTVLVLGTNLGPAFAADPGAPINQQRPTVSGAAQVGGVLTANAGTWTPEPTSYSYVWLRDGAAFTAPSTSESYAVTEADLGHTLAVRVTATNGQVTSDPADSDPTGVVTRAFTPGAAPQVAGVLRWGRTLTGSAGSSVPEPTSVAYQWLRSGQVIPGATGSTYLLRADDFGSRITLRVTFVRTGYTSLVRSSPATAPIGHRVPVRKRFTYSITTRGKVTANLAEFARLTAQSFADPRGWRSAGYRFTRVRRGGNFTLVLASARSLPSFGWPCSSMWSCRVGRNVVINQTRWLNASPAWNAAGLRLRDYRHMVLNHETGHWLGHRHRGCPGPGRLAPVMMQQSKGMNGCRFNPFPLPSERWTRH